MITETADLPFPYNIAMIWFTDEDPEYARKIIDELEYEYNDIWAVHEQRIAEQIVYGRNL